MFKEWVTWIFKIPRVGYVSYEDNEKKILIINVAKRGKKVKKMIFTVEHLVDENLRFTNETLAQEKELFPKIN